MLRCGAWQVAVLTTLWGLLVAEPSLVMLMLDVLDARMVCTDVICTHTAGQQHKQHRNMISADTNHQGQDRHNPRGVVSLRPTPQTCLPCMPQGPQEVAPAVIWRGMILFCACPLNHSNKALQGLTTASDMIIL
jgi:hypothetical protein